MLILLAQNRWAGIGLLVQVALESHRRSRWIVHYFAHEYDLAMEYCKRALALDDGFQIAKYYVIDIYLMKGMEQQAFEMWISGNYVDERPSEEKAFPEIFLRDGWRGILLWELRQNSKYRDPRVEGLAAMHLAKVHLSLGNPEQALHYLEKSFAEHSFMLPFLKVDPRYDSLRQHPRFQNIVQRVGL